MVMVTAVESRALQGIFAKIVACI